MPGFRTLTPTPPDPNIRLQERLADLERRLADQERLNFTPDTYYYSEVNGGAQQVLPNSGAWVNALKSDDSTPVGFTLTVPSGPSQQWWLEGGLLMRADSANDTPLAAAILLNSTPYAIAYTSRNYWGGTTNLQGWMLGQPKRLVTLAAGSYTVRLAGRATTGYGGLFDRSDAANGGIVFARRVA